MYIFVRIRQFHTKLSPISYERQRYTRYKTCLNHLFFKELIGISRLAQSLLVSSIGCVNDQTITQV